MSYILSENAEIYNKLLSQRFNGDDVREPLPVKSGTASVAPLPSVTTGTGVNIPGTAGPKTLPGPTKPATPKVISTAQSGPKGETVTNIPSTPQKKSLPIGIIAGAGILLYLFFRK